MPVIKINDLDLSNITFSDIKTDNNGRKMVFVNNNGGKILVQTPKMFAPNGLKRWRKKDATDNKDDSFEIELSFIGEDNDSKNGKEIHNMHKKLEEFDNLIKNKIQEHSKEWLGKPKVSMELIENAFYTPIVKIATDKEGNILDYPSRVRVKLDRERNGDNFTGRFLSHKRPPTEILVFNHNKERIPMNEDNFELVIPKASQVIAVMELVYLSITTKVSAKWKLVQAKVESNSTNITSYAMLDDVEEANYENEVSLKNLSLEEQPQQHLEEHPEEHPEEQENDPLEPEPVVVVKSKRVSKK